MAKRSSRGLSKKGIENLIRITNKGNKRVWSFQGNEYENLRQVVDIHNRQRNIKLLAKSKEKDKDKVKG